MRASSRRRGEVVAHFAEDLEAHGGCAENVDEICIDKSASYRAAEAEPLLERWYSWARRCRLEPIKHVATTLKRHWAGILNAFDSKLTNGRVEAATSLIQAAKAKARGYGTTRHLIAIAHLVAAKLAHLPASPFHTAKEAMLGTQTD